MMMWDSLRKFQILDKQTGCFEHMSSIQVDALHYKLEFVHCHALTRLSLMVVDNSVFEWELAEIRSIVN
jgi:hypothetical protein